MLSVANKTTSLKPRSEEIDLTKGLLTIGMIFAHVIQFFGHGDSTVLSYFSLLTNLVSYSGFIFCFGYAAWCAYLSKPNAPWFAVCRTAFKCYVAFVLSGMSFLLIYSKVPLTLELVKSVAFIQVLPGYSEFLITFSFLLLLALPLKPLVVKATNSVGALILSSWILIGLVFVSREPLHALLPPVLRTPVDVLVTGGFPVLKYACFFLAGVYLGRHAPKFRVHWLIVSFLLTAFFVALWQNGVVIARFPVSVPWIIFGFSTLYIYYSFAIFLALADIRPINSYISFVGKNVLFYLVISNIIIFTLKGNEIVYSIDYFDMYIPFVAIMLIIIFLQGIIIAPSKQTKT